MENNPTLQKEYSQDSWFSRFITYLFSSSSKSSNINGTPFTHSFACTQSFSGDESNTGLEISAHPEQNPTA